MSSASESEPGGHAREVADAPDIWRDGLTDAQAYPRVVKSFVGARVDARRRQQNHFGPLEGPSVASLAMDVGAPDGHGRFAVIDEQTDGLLCHECGRRFRALPPVRGHGV